MENNEVVQPTRSEELNKLFEALGKAQGEIRNAELNAKNPFFKSNYADLGEIVKASRPALTKHGLSVIQLVLPAADGYSYLHSVLGHASGQWIESRMRINPSKSDVQSFGSCITYLRRYSYAALVGVVCGDEDDDGQAAMTAAPVHVPRDTKPKYANYEKLSQDQLNEITYELEGHPAIGTKVMNGWGVDKLSDIPSAKYRYTLDKIRELKAAEGKK